MNVLLWPATAPRSFFLCSRRVSAVAVAVAAVTVPAPAPLQAISLGHYRRHQQPQWQSKFHSSLALKRRDLTSSAISRVMMMNGGGANANANSNVPVRRFRLERGLRKPTKPDATESPLPAKPAAEVHEDIYTLPNILTFSRLLAAPAIGYLVLHDYHTWAVGLFAYAGITDMLDGWIARRWNQRTVVGTVIDPAADKMLMTILTVCLAMKGGLPVWLAVVILGRDVGLAISAIYYRYISLPPPKTFTRYWDLSIPSAEVHPTTISKVNTALQLGLIGLTTATPVIPYDISTAMFYFQYLVATTTVWSGASYVYSKDAVKILNKQNHKKA